MVAQNKFGVASQHSLGAAGQVLLGQTRQVLSQPCLPSCWLDEHIAHAIKRRCLFALRIARHGLTQSSPKNREVGAFCGQQAKHRINQFVVAVFDLLQSQFGCHAKVQLHWVDGFVKVKYFNRGILVLDQRKQRLTQAIQVPKRDLWLSCVGIAPLVIGVVTNMSGVKTI